MYDGPNEDEKKNEETRIESTDSETTLFISVEIAEVTGGGHPGRRTMDDDADNVMTNEAGGRMKMRISSCSTTTLSRTIRTTAWTKKMKKSNGMKRN